MSIGGKPARACRSTYETWTACHRHYTLLIIDQLTVIAELNAIKMKLNGSPAYHVQERSLSIGI